MTAEKLTSFWLRVEYPDGRTETLEFTALGPGRACKAFARRQREAGDPVKQIKTGEGLEEYVYLADLDRENG